MSPLHLHLQELLFTQRSKERPHGRELCTNQNISNKPERMSVECPVTDCGSEEINVGFSEFGAGSGLLAPLLPFVD